MDHVSDPYWWRKTWWHDPHMDSTTDGWDSRLNVANHESLQLDSYQSRRVITDASYRYHAFGIRVPMAVIDDPVSLDLARTFLARIKPLHTFWIFDVAVDFVDDYRADSDDDPAYPSHLVDVLELAPSLDFVDVLRNPSHWDNPMITLDNQAFGVDAHYDQPEGEVFWIELFPDTLEFIEALLPQSQLDSGVPLDRGRFDQENETERFEEIELVGPSATMEFYDHALQVMDQPDEVMDDGETMDLTWPADGAVDFALTPTLPPAGYEPL